MHKCNDVADLPSVIKIRLKKIDSSHPAFQGHPRSLELTSAIKDFLLVFNSNFVFLDNRLQKCCDLEIRVRGHSRSLKVVPFDRLGRISCLAFYTKASTCDFVLQRTLLRLAEVLCKCINVAGPHAWNSLPSHIRTLVPRDSFSRHLKTHFFKLSYMTFSDLFLFHIAVLTVYVLVSIFNVSF